MVTRACILYLDQPKEIGCRKCLNLAYESQYYRHPAPKLLKANKLRKQIGGKAGLINPLPERPKGMHLNTYEKALLEIIGLEHEQVIEIYKRMITQTIETDRLAQRFD